MKEKTISFLLIIISFIIIFLPLVMFIFNIFLNLNFEILATYFNKEIIYLFFYTCALSFVVAVFSTLLGFFIALAVEIYEIKFASKFKSLFFIPLVLPTYLFTFSWLGFLGKRGTLTEFQMPNLPINIYTPEFLVFIFTISFFPISMILCILGMKNIPSELVEAGKIFIRRKIITKIIIPLMKPYLFVSFFIIFFLFFSEYITPSYLGINLYQNEIFTQLGAFYNIYGAGILSVPIFLTGFAMNFIILYYFKKRNFAIISGEMKKDYKKLKIKPKNEKIILIFLILLALLCVAIPFFMLLMESEFSFIKAISSAKNEIINSIFLSLLSSFLIVIFSFFVILFIKNKLYLNLLIVLPFSVPSIIIAISLIHFYQFLSFNTLFLSLIHGLVIKFLPYSILLFASFSEQLSKSIEESGKIFITGLNKRISKIFIPIFWKSITVSFLLVFILSISEVSITQLLIPPGFQTFSIKIDILMHYGSYSHVSSLLLFLIFLAFIGYYLIEVRKWK